MRNHTALWIVSSCLISGLVIASEPDSGNSNVDANLDPGRSLISPARGLFLQVDAGAAAARIRQGSREFRATARNAASDSREMLIEAANELEDLSRNVESRGVKMVEELDKPFALRVPRRLPNIMFGQVCSNGNCANVIRQAIGCALPPTIWNGSLRQLVIVSSSTANEAVRESRLVAGKLIENAGYATDEVGKTFESLGKQVEAAGHNIEPVASRKSDTSKQ